MKNFVHILLTVLLAAACSGTTGVPEEDFSRAVSDHLSSGQVNAFAEDSLGHVWVATSRGLNRYDGRYYHQFFASADSLSLPDNHVNDLCFDRDGLLWVAVSEDFSIECKKHRKTALDQRSIASNIGLIHLPVFSSFIMNGSL